MGIVRTIIIAVLLCLSGYSVAWGQTPPDMEAIRNSVSDPASPYYYDRLFQRYEAMDTTLNFEEYYHLYYGYAEQVQYMPLLDNSARKELETIMSGRVNPTKEDYVKAIDLATAILRVEPFNMRDINALAYLYAITGREQIAQRLMARVNIIAEVITSTGTGLTGDEAWWITYFAHAQDIINLRGLTQQGVPIVLSATVEFIPTAKQQGKPDKGYYFNYSIIYEREPDYLENFDNPKREMNFNPMENTPRYKL